ncbi:FAD/NAD(P)-binding protein [Aquabacterium sp. A08]|uniref:FAD/NAD(P)-binding protein n=1 Tax=Aquabacterium sp. A08 TaxID=2718532 RepID=UPI001424A3C2|nr:FAD-dependent oxidoreductase [Aquabacterium sp. A08]
MTSSNPSSSPRRITIVGGGFTGVSAAVQLVRHAPFPLEITLIESRERVGPGLAYSTSDPDHRLNGPAWIHSVDPTEGAHFLRWCEAQGVFQRDPDAVQASGAAFVRRSEFGRYLEDTLRAHSVWPATGSTIEVLRDTAIDVVSHGQSVKVMTSGGHASPADVVLLATGNAVPRLQRPLDQCLERHPAVIANPLETWRLAGIPVEARVLVIGSGLTALDVLSTLRRQGHQAPVVVLSRRGLRPRAQAPHNVPMEQPTGRQLLDRVLNQPPAFITQAPPTLRAWLKALRVRIREDAALGRSWHVAFDELRDTVWQLWPRLPETQQRRFLGKLRTWYDVHRFRSPPPTEAIVNAALARGQVYLRAARLLSVEPMAGGPGLLVRSRRSSKDEVSEEQFDAVVNCTGLDVAARTAANPLLSALVRSGRLQVDACGVGYSVDANCRAVDANGQAQPSLRVIGPPTLGTFGDPAGAMYIAAQIHRLLPDVWQTLVSGSTSKSGGPASVACAKV